VNYDNENWMALINQLNNTPTEIHVLNRAQLISDSFNLARAGQLNYTVPLELTKYLKNENSTTPWYSAMQGFSYLLQQMPRSEKGYKKLKVHATYKYVP
jgi:aminopeptidase N